MTAPAAGAHRVRIGHPGRRAACVVVALLLVATGARGSNAFRVGRPAAGTPGSPGHPNLVLILTDDLDLAAMPYMESVHKLLSERGTSFSTFLISEPLCCPSRATMLRGQYAHNTGIHRNGPPSGGFEDFRDVGLEQSTLATWLQDGGYLTAMMGKYLNGYPAGDPAYVPPGWDEWVSPVDGFPYRNFSFLLNENGEIFAYDPDPQNYLTDVIARRATSFIRAAAAAGRPFFLLVPTYAPHSPATPAPRHESLFAGESAPRKPSFDEEDVSDRPLWVHVLSPLSGGAIAGMDGLWRNRLRSLQAVDELVRDVFSTLDEAGVLDETFVFFTSDNGFHMGEHRMLAGKGTAYEEDIRVPFLVRGPGVGEGVEISYLVGNVDLAPTLVDLAAIQAPPWVDGFSFAPLLVAGNPPTRGWRDAYLLESADFSSVDQEPARAAPRDAPTGVLEPDDETGAVLMEPIRQREPAFTGIRTATLTYVEYETGERELYDLEADPFQLENAVTTADQALLDRLAADLDQLRVCQGKSCNLWAFDEAPPPRARRRAADPTTATSREPSRRAARHRRR